MLPGGTVSVGFSLQQMEVSGNQLILNGAVLVSDLLAHFAYELENQGNLNGFVSRDGYIRIDAGVGEFINTITLNNTGGDGFAIDHFAFKVQAAVDGVPVPGALALLCSGLIGFGRLRRRA